jgi:hypothetical protein
MPFIFKQFFFALLVVATVPFLIIESTIIGIAKGFSDFKDAITKSYQKMKEDHYKKT